MMVGPDDFLHMSTRELAEKHVELLNQHDVLKQQYHDLVEQVKRDAAKIDNLNKKLNETENDASELSDELDRQKGVSVGFMSKIVLQAKLNKALLEALSAYEALSHLKE